MKTEIYKKLKPFEAYLEQSLKDYMRVPSRDFAELAKIYAEHFGKVLTASERTCGHCQLRALKRLAADYFKFKESPYCKGLEKQEEKENGEGNGTTEG